MTAPSRLMMAALAAISTNALPHTSLASEAVEQIVVTGTRTPKTLEDSPVAIDIVTSEEIAQVTTGTLASALAFIPGVVLTQNEKYGYTVMMQGFDSDRVLVLVDGMPLISPTGESVDLDQISANDIERIEIVRGAASSLYGSSAMGGVINIFTKQYQGNGLKAVAEYGRYNDYAINDDDTVTDYVVTGYTNIAGWQFKLTGQRLDRPGYRYLADGKIDDAAGVEKSFYSAQIRGELAGISVVYQPQYFEESKVKAAGLLPDRSQDYYRSDVEQYQHDINFRGNSAWHLNTRLNHHDEISGRKTTKRSAKIDNTIIDGQKTWTQAALELVSGGKYAKQSINQISLKDGSVELDKSRHSTELFAQADWQASDSLSLVAGFRGQHNSTFGEHTALRINSLWQPASLGDYGFQWRASLGEGYRVPSLKENFYEFDHSAIGYMVLGNTDLVPETSVTLTNTFTFELPISKSGLDIELSAYQSKAKDYILTVQNDEKSAQETLSIYEYTNFDRVDIRGADFSIGQSEKMRWQINYTYLDARNSHTDERLPERPRHQIKANIEWPITAKQSLLVYGTYEADKAAAKDTDGLPKKIINSHYTTINARWAWRVTDAFAWRLGIDNIGNQHKDPTIEEQSEFDIAPISNRYVFTKLEYHLH